MKFSHYLKKTINLTRKNWLLILVILVGAILRFYNLNWDRGYFFNPDESNNIAHPSANLKFPLHPGNFVYGSFNIYLYRLGALIMSLLTGSQAWSQAAQINIIGRFVSATISVCLIFLVFFLGKRLFSSRVGLLAAVLTSFNVGLIQAAHFGTTEIILTLGGVLTAIAIIVILKEKKYQHGYLLGMISLGLAAGAKVSALVFLPSLLLAHLFALTRKNFLARNQWLIAAGLLMFLVFFLVFPFSILDFPSFKNAFINERNIATGETPIFFSGQFQRTKPYLFQLTKVLPWTLGWPVLIFGLLGLFTLFFQSIKNNDEKKYLLFFLPTFYFLFNGSLFVKWTRYMIPLSPFFCLLTAFFLLEIYNQSQKRKKIKPIISFIIIAVVALQALYAMAFFNIYQRPDTRIAASEWIYRNLPPKKTLLLEPLDVASLPLSVSNRHPSEYSQIWFDFYALDDPPEWPRKVALVEQLSNQLATSDYLLIGSRRVYANRLRLSDLFPLTTRYYLLLFDGTLGFDKIKEFSSYPKVLGVEINDDMAEETFQVFDHPKVMIFKNTKKLPSDVLKTLLLND